MVEREMNAIDRLLELAVKHGCDELSPNCEVCKEMEQLMKEVRKAVKLQEIVKKTIESDSRALVDVQNWLSKDGKKFTEFEYKILKVLVEESEK